jgi:hypothetical protein
MYTVMETQKLTEGYANGLPLADLASELGKTEKSIIGKLVNLALYVPKVKASKVTGEAIKTKASYAKDIEKILEVELPDLDKAPKTTLVKLLTSVEGWLGDSN